MAAEIITKEDLQQFKVELLQELKQFVKQPSPTKEWLKSYEVKKLLKISSGTLHALRAKGILRYTKIGGLLYYKNEDLVKVMEGPKSN